MPHSLMEQLVFAALTFAFAFTAARFRGLVLHRTKRK
jgi:hypothetical protein